MKQLCLLLLALITMQTAVAVPLFEANCTYEFKGYTLSFYCDAPNRSAMLLQVESPIVGEFEIPDKIVFEGAECLVDHIGISALAYKTGMTSVKIPNTVKSIWNHAFYYCPDLTSVVIPNSVTNMDEGAFEECTSLKSVVLSDALQYVADYTFSGCTSLKSIDIPESVVFLGFGAFMRCKSLTSVKLPASLSSIGSMAFAETDLTTVTIPGLIKSIGSSAFKDCLNLKYVYYDCENPISGPTIFDRGMTASVDAVLYVPAGAVGICKSISPWMYVRNIQAYDFTNGIEDVMSDFDQSKPYEVFDIKGVKVGRSIDGTAPGIYFIRQGRAVRKISVQ